MNFSDVKQWVIPEGDVKKVVDSNNRVIWEKDFYFYIDNLTNATNTVTIKRQSSSSPKIEVFGSENEIDWVSLGQTDYADRYTIHKDIPANSRLYLKATVNDWNSNIITASGNHNVGGNIMSLMYGDNFRNKRVFPANTGCFQNLFYGNTTLVSAEKLKLPATTLNELSYRWMFRNCTSLTVAPTLPATTLAPNCYEYMFIGCSSLTTAPALPVATLASSCYGFMFNGCTSLTAAPALPATTLASSCYSSMFANCTSLTTAPELPATTLVDWCYSTMFDGCTGLTEAPVLPATKLTRYCYYGMFRQCANISKVITYASNISATSCLQDWLSNVSATGDFYNLGGATYPSGASGIPTGWTEHNSL